MNYIYSQLFGYPSNESLIIKIAEPTIIEPIVTEQVVIEPLVIEPLVTNPIGIERKITDKITDIPVFFPQNKNAKLIPSFSERCLNSLVRELQSKQIVLVKHNSTVLSFHHKVNNEHFVVFINPVMDASTKTIDMNLSSKELFYPHRKSLPELCKWLNFHKIKAVSDDVSLTLIVPHLIEDQILSSFKIYVHNDIINISNTHNID